MIYSWDTEAVFSNETGTGWTLDVTAANLSTRLEEKDFVVAFNGLMAANELFTKLSSTAVRYDGPATGDVFVEFRRDTGVDPFRLATYTDVILSGDYNRNFERVSRKLAEFDAFGVGDLGEVTIVDDSYGSGWQADTLNGASRASLHAKFEAQESDYTTLISDTEGALQTQINTKVGANSPSFTGTPTAPTPPLDNSTTRLATTAYVKGNQASLSTTLTNDINDAIDDLSESLTNDLTASILQAARESLYPVGSIYMNATSSENPATLLGFGTWSPTLVGRVAVGLDSTQVEFDTMGETGGEKTHALTAEENGPHAHDQNSSLFYQSGGSTGAARGLFSGTRYVGTFSSGLGSPHNNLQPYQVVRAWVRTA